ACRRKVVEGNAVPYLRRWPPRIDSADRRSARQIQTISQLCLRRRRLPPRGLRDASARRSKALAFLAGSRLRHPQQWLANREVSDDLGHDGVGVERLPQSDVVVLAI